MNSCKIFGSQLTHVNVRISSSNIISNCFISQLTFHDFIVLKRHVFIVSPSGEMRSRRLHATPIMSYLFIFFFDLIIDQFQWLELIFLTSLKREPFILTQK